MIVCAVCACSDAATERRFQDLHTIGYRLIHYVVAIDCSFSVNHGKKCLINHHKMIMGHGTLFR
jgi:hypothetical protein